MGNSLFGRAILRSLRGRRRRRILVLHRRRRLTKLRHVGTNRQLDTNLIFASRLFVVLGEAPPHLPRRHANNRIRARVICRFPSEDLNP